MSLQDEYNHTFRDDCVGFFGREPNEQYAVFVAGRPDGNAYKRALVSRCSNFGVGSTIIDLYRHDWYAAYSWMPELAWPSANDFRSRFVQTYAPGRRFLEYGAASAHFALLAAAAGAARVTIVDVPHAWFSFLCWRANRHKWPIDFIPVEDELPLRRTIGADTVLCWEVLEHVNNPVKSLWDITARMPVGAVMCLSTFYNDCGDTNDPDATHLVWNNVFQETYLWFEVLRRFGFELLERDANGVEKVFRKVRPLRWDLSKSDRMFRTGRWNDEPEPTPTV